MNSLLEPPQRNSACWHTDLAQWGLFWTCAFQNHKIIHLCYFKHVVLCYSSNRRLIHIGKQVVPPWSSYVQYKREAFPCLTGWGAVTQTSKVDLIAMDPHHWTRGSLGRRSCSLCRGHRGAGSRHSHKGWCPGVAHNLSRDRGAVRDRKGCVWELKTNPASLCSLLYVQSQNPIYFEFQIT